MIDSSTVQLSLEQHFPGSQVTVLPTELCTNVSIEIGSVTLHADITDSATLDEFVSTIASIIK